ncbi:hypothetical protein [Deinococcus multiflagellatus]|uniref:DUF4190 domain-containing protein n=1 Tax=Deinococcus multiflagellatus TaxID=1656887 RepID=A0ABW1ZIJ6_9DEIO|nr:hypothetical protein [Deinococcus multiflagellatus]MBZ9714332.1 hypothetical protein [Deinococcus multiflagellatus]
MTGAPAPRRPWRLAGTISVGLGVTGMLIGGLLALPGLGLGFVLALSGGGPEALKDAPDVGPALVLLTAAFGLTVAGVGCLIASSWLDPR